MHFFSIFLTNISYSSVFFENGQLEKQEYNGQIFTISYDIKF